MGVAPPFVGNAVKVTELPRQKGLDDADMETLTADLGVTDAGYGMLDAGLFDVQSSEEVSVQVIRSPFVGM